MEWPFSGPALAPLLRLFGDLRGAGFSLSAKGSKLTAPEARRTESGAGCRLGDADDTNADAADDPPLAGFLDVRGEPLVFAALGDGVVAELCWAESLADFLGRFQS